MIRYVYLDRASGFGSVYDFQYAGDALPLHQHGPEEEHSVSVLRGCVKLLVLGEKQRLLNAGETAVFDSTKPHTVIAREPDTMTFHRYVNGKPASYTPEVLAGGELE